MLHHGRRGVGVSREDRSAVLDSLCLSLSLSVRRHPVVPLLRQQGVGKRGKEGHSLTHILPACLGGVCR